MGLRREARSPGRCTRRTIDDRSDASPPFAWGEKGRGLKKSISGNRMARPHQIAFFNHKGGVAKTTSAFNIGWKLAELGSKVMLADCDPQCNLTGLVLEYSHEEEYPFEGARGDAPATYEMDSPLLSMRALFLSGPSSFNPFRNSRTCLSYPAMLRSRRMQTLSRSHMNFPIPLLHYRISPDHFGICLT